MNECSHLTAPEFCCCCFCLKMPLILCSGSKGQIQSIDCFCSSRRLIAVRSSLSTQLFLLIVASSVSVRRLFMLFYSPVPLQSVDCFCSSRRLIASLLASFTLVRRFFHAVLVAHSASVLRLFYARLLIASLFTSFAVVRRLLLLF